MLPKYLVSSLIGYLKENWPEAISMIWETELAILRMAFVVFRSPSSIFNKSLPLAVIIDYDLIM